MFGLNKGELNPDHSAKMKGSGNPRYGMVVSFETREKIRNIHKTKGTFKGVNNPMYGKTHDEETRKKISEYNKLRSKGELNPFYGKKHSAKTKKLISQIRVIRELAKGEKNPMYKKNHKEETKIKQANIRRAFIIKNPEKSINYIIVKNYKNQTNKKGGYISKKQAEIYELLKKYFKDAELNYPIVTSQTVYFADIGIPSIKLDIEYDGSFWHTDISKEVKRDINIQNIGWKVLRIKDKELYNIITNTGLINYVKLFISECS